MSVFQARGLAFASASHPRLGAGSLVYQLDPSVIKLIFEHAFTTPHVLPTESGVPVVPVDSRMRTYALSETPSPFGYRITVGDGVVDEGFVPRDMGSVSGFVYFFGPTVSSYGRLRVTVSTMGDRRLFLQIGCWRKVSDAESDDDTTGVPVYCAGLVYRDKLIVSVEDTACFTFPAPFVGSIELFLV